MPSSSTYHQHLHRKKECKALIHNSTTKRSANTMLKLWTAERMLLGYAQKQIEATKLYNYSHIQRRLKTLPPLAELLNTKKISEWTRARIADLAEKIDDKRQWPEKAIRAAIALRPKGAPRYTMIKYRLKNSTGKTVRFILPTDRDLKSSFVENPVKLKNDSTTTKPISTRAFNIRKNDFITIKAIPTTKILDFSKVQSNNITTFPAPPVVAASKNKKKKRRSSKRKSNINVAPVPTKRNTWTKQSQKCVTNSTLCKSEDVSNKSVMSAVSAAYDWYLSMPLLCLTHYGIHPLQQDCTPRKPILHNYLSENSTTSSTVIPSGNEWTDVRLADLAEALPDKTLWPKGAIAAALALRPKHIPPWSRFRCSLRTSSGKPIKIVLPKQK